MGGKSYGKTCSEIKKPDGDSVRLIIGSQCSGAFANNSLAFSILSFEETRSVSSFENSNLTLIFPLPKYLARPLKSHLTPRKTGFTVLQMGQVMALSIADILPTMLIISRIDVFPQLLGPINMLRSRNSSSFTCFIR